jgi:hypothetical protein
MLKRSLKLLLIMAFVIVQTTFAQERPRRASKEFKAREVISLGDAMTVKGAPGVRPLISGLKFKGESFVAVLDFNAKKAAGIIYNLSIDPDTTGVALLIGGKKYAPVATMDDFPSWGRDNDKEIEPLEKDDTEGSVSVRFDGRGSVSFFFDLPAGSGKIS